MAGKRIGEIKLRRPAGRIFRLGCDWVGSFSRLFNRLRGSGNYVRVGQEQPEMAPPDVPKGHLAVHLDGGNGDTCRVPVVYFNHPLFVELLRKADNVYGFDHPGGIQIPCPMSEFENVRMRIAATEGGGCNRRGWRGFRFLKCNSCMYC